MAFIVVYNTTAVPILIGQHWIPPQEFGVADEDLAQRELARLLLVRPYPFDADEDGLDVEAVASARLAAELNGGPYVPPPDGPKSLAQRVADLEASLGSGGVADGAVTAEKLADGAVVNRVLGAGSVTDAKVAAANKDGSATTPSMRTLGDLPEQAASGNDPRLQDARPPLQHEHGIDSFDLSDLVTALLTTTTPEEAKTVLEIASTALQLGTTAETAAAGNDARLSDQRVPSNASVDDSKVKTGAAISLDKTVDGAQRSALSLLDRQRLDGLFATNVAVKVVVFDGTTWPGSESWSASQVMFLFSLEHPTAPPPPGMSGKPLWLWFKRKSA